MCLNLIWLKAKRYQHEPHLQKVALNSNLVYQFNDSKKVHLPDSSRKILDLQSNQRN